MVRRHGLITRGKSTLRKVIDQNRTFLDEHGQPFDEHSLIDMALVHPRSGDRKARSIAKILLQKIAST